MGGRALLGSDILPAGLVLAVLVPAWAAALLSMGYLQWRVLRSPLPRSRRWIWVTAGAWLLGVMIPVVALSAAPDVWPAWAHAIIGVLAAVAMGAVVGALTGRTLERILHPPT
jgi:VIT1/CCC1 family predicted Fe2+/Mn2+ transporter